MAYFLRQFSLWIMYTVLWFFCCCGERVLNFAQPFGDAPDWSEFSYSPWKWTRSWLASATEQKFHRPKLSNLSYSQDMTFLGWHLFGSPYQSEARARSRICTAYFFSSITWLKFYFYEWNLCFFKATNLFKNAFAVIMPLYSVEFIILMSKSILWNGSHRYIVTFCAVLWVATFIVSTLESWC